MGDQTAPNDANQAIVPLAPPPETIQKNLLSRAADFLQDNSRIGAVRVRYDKYRRYVELYLQDIFNALVTLYQSLFISKWQDFKRFMEYFTPPPGVTPVAYATRSYISSWIYDLYVSNREAVRKLSPIAFSQHFQHELAPFSYEYDYFLTQVNAAVRPTHIQGVTEDTLYIPILSQNPSWNSDNPFNLNGFVYNYDITIGLIGIMKDRKSWNITTLMTTTIGRPSWLFDWHSESRVCAWFPTEGNYNMDDVSIAYIIGVACSPNLGPRDVDDWRNLPSGYSTLLINPATTERSVPRRFFGSYEVRTIGSRQVAASFQTDDETDPSAGAAKRKRTSTVSKQSLTGAVPTEGNQVESATTQEIVPLVTQYQIVDWTYYQLVVLNLEVHTRSGALKMLVHK